MAWSNINIRFTGNKLLDVSNLCSVFIFSFLSYHVMFVPTLLRDLRSDSFSHVLNVCRCVLHVYVCLFA